MVPCHGIPDRNCARFVAQQAGSEWGDVFDQVDKEGRSALHLLCDHTGHEGVVRRDDPRTCFESDADGHNAYRCNEWPRRG